VSRFLVATDALVVGEPLTPPLPALSMTSHLSNWVLTLAVAGEADIATAPLWREQLGDAYTAWPYALVLDLSGLLFCGLAGLDVLNEALARGNAAGALTTVTGMSQQLTWLRRTFPDPSRPPQSRRREDPKDLRFARHVT
jgi:anti-anti-sigma factor